MGKRAAVIALVALVIVASSETVSFGQFIGLKDWCSLLGMSWDDGTHTCVLSPNYYYKTYWTLPILPEETFVIGSTNGFHTAASLSNAGTIINSGVLENSGAIANTGSIENSGTFLNSGVLKNTGTIANTGSIENSGTFLNSGYILNTGTFSNSDVIYNYGVIENYGTVDNSGTVYNLCGGLLLAIPPSNNGGVVYELHECRYLPAVLHGS